MVDVDAGRVVVVTAGWVVVAAGCVVVAAGCVVVVEAGWVVVGGGVVVVVGLGAEPAIRYGLLAVFQWVERYEFTGGAVLK